MKRIASGSRSPRRITAPGPFVKLQQDALGNPWPRPLFKLWRADDPPLGERIELSNDYHPGERARLYATRADSGTDGSGASTAVMSSSLL
jgi:hypothetical protein